MQTMKASKKGKEPAAGRSVSEIGAEERRDQQYSPYHKRDKDGGETNGGDLPQGRSEQRRAQHTPAQATPT